MMGNSELSLENRKSFPWIQRLVSSFQYQMKFWRNQAQTSENYSTAHDGVAYNVVQKKLDDSSSAVVKS